MRTGNPVLREATFSGLSSADSNNQMTINGTVNKSFITLLLLVISATLTWNLYNAGYEVLGLAIGSSLVAFIIAFTTHFVKKIAPVTTPIYALLQGVAVGGISAYFEMEFDGITQQAVLLTFGVFAGLLFAYKSRWIEVTQKFRRGVIAATLGIMLVYVLNFILSFFGMSVPYLHESSMLGIGISIAIVIVAALNLVLDFDYIEQGAMNGAPKYMEWYSSLALMITLVWLYLEILRLLAKIYNNRR